MLPHDDGLKCLPPLLRKDQTDTETYTDLGSWLDSEWG